MTSVSQPQIISTPDHNSSGQSVAPANAAGPATAAGRSYATATRPASTSAHAKSDSYSTVNGRSTIAPAVPTLAAGPTIANGNNALNSGAYSSDHNRKASVTISAAGSTGQMPNGGPLVGAPGGGHPVRFGAFDTPSSPAMSNRIPDGQSGNSLTVSSPSNPRLTSPTSSPAPIPQPAASGGRPPSSLHGNSNSVSFGAFGGDDTSRQRLPTPGLQAPNLRRDSSQSSHQDISGSVHNPNGGGRGGFSNGRGRGGYNHQQQQQQYPSHMNSPNASFRQLPNASRGAHMAQPFTPTRGNFGPSFAPSHQGGRSPHVSHAQIHQQQGQMGMQNQQMPQYGHGSQMGHYNQGQYMAPGYSYDPGYAYYQQNQGYMPAQNGQYPGPPPSPHNTYGVPQGNPQYQQTNPYGPPPTMSRTPSAVSERPSSTLSQPPQTPMTATSSQQAPQARGPSVSASRSQVAQPTKKSAAIKIVNPDTGEAVLPSKQAPPPPSPAHAPSIKSPAPVSAPTPPPPTPGLQHARTESKTAKSPADLAAELKEQVRKKIEDNDQKEKEAKDKEAEEARLVKEKEDAEAAALKEREDADNAAQAEAAAQAEEEERRAAEEAEAKAAQEAKAAEEAKIAEEKRVAEEAKDAADAKAKADADAEAKAKTEAENASKAAAEKNAPEEPDLEDDEYWERVAAEEEAKERAMEEAYLKKKAAAKEEQDRKDKEAAAKADEEMREAERKAEELEAAKAKRLEQNDGKDEGIDAFAGLKRSEGAFKATETATEALPSLDTPTSGAATPQSETSSSMGPPPPRAAGSVKKIPAALKIETNKPVEAAQPSAALQSLRSARILMNVSAKLYPEGIASPNPALNSAAPMGKFRYDKDFLLQFQKAFTDKPSETWNEKVKETVGDTSEQSASARRGGGASMNQRQASRGGPAAVGGGAFSGPMGMGSFGSNQRTVPQTSAERFKESSKPTGTSMANPIRYPASGPGFPGGFPLPRQQSAAIPQSPRQPSQRGGSKRGPAKGHDHKADNAMPLTANMNLAPIQVTAAGWKPSSIGRGAASGPPPGGEDGYLAPDIVQKKVKSALNKLTPTTFDKITGQILEIVMQSKKETDGRTLRQVIQLTFEKATDEPHWSAMYAEFCYKMLQNMSAEIKDENLTDKNGVVASGTTLFRKYLLNRCQQDFERGWKSKLPDKPEGSDQSQEATMLSDEYYIAATAKRRGLGLVRFIGELFKLGMLLPKIMHMCVQKLVDVEGMPDEAEVESLTSLLRTIGETLDGDERSRAMMNAYFERIESMVNMEGLPSRLKFMLLDTVELRKHNWKGKGAAIKGPAKIDEIHAQAAEQARQAEIQRAADSSRSNRGGGRPGIGRGDVRNASGQFMQPPDYAKNTLDANDLRRLGKSTSRQGTQNQTFGPTTLFGGRQGSKKGGLTPGGIFGRTDDSGPNSRTATPPITKKDDKEPTTSANAFSALADIDSTGDANDALSPTSTSPELAKRPLPNRTRSKSPLTEGGDAPGS